jgi:hypothetical protein
MVDSTVDLAYAHRLSSVNQRLNNVDTGNNFTPHIQAATTEDIQGLQQKISELKIENLKLKVESLESAAIKSGEMPDPYKAKTESAKIQGTKAAQTKPAACIQPGATQPQDKLAELNAAKAELAAAKAELTNPSANNSNKNIKELSKDLFQLNVENKELQRNALLEEKEALSTTTPASTPFPCNQNPVNPRENELKIELAAAEKELKNAQNLLNKDSDDNAPQFISKAYVNLLDTITSESINDSKEYRKEQLETKIEKLEANLNSRPSNPYPCLNQQNDNDSNTQKLLAEAKAELATIKN